MVCCTIPRTDAPTFPTGQYLQTILFSYGVLPCRCTHVWMNVGIHMTGRGKMFDDTVWSLDEYHARVQQLASLLSQLAEKRVAIFWEATHALPITGVQFNADKKACKSYHYDGSQCSEPRIRALNSIAESVMSQFNIPFIDTWSVTAHLTDLSFDAVHYHPNGTVGQVLLKVVAHFLCSNS